MQVSKKILTLIAILAIAMACSSTQIVVKSEPEGAKVSLRTFGQSNKFSPGKTPITLDAEEMRTKLKTEGPVIIEVEKTGFLNQSFIVADIEAAELDLNFELPMTTGLESPKVLNGIIDKLFESQRLARVGNFEEALKWLDEIEKQSPRLSALHEIRGGIKLLQKKYREALDSYFLTVKYNPDNVEAIRIRNALEKSLDVKREDVEEGLIKALTTNNTNEEKEGVAGAGGTEEESRKPAEEQKKEGEQ